MGGAVSSGRDNNELIDNLMGGNYIRSRDVERVFRALDRADYMTPESRDQAYKDLAWRNGPLHMSAPCIYSEVMEGLELKPGLSFLNIGSGTGYLSTLVGLILGSSGISHGVEVHHKVLEYSTKKLQQFLENSPTLDEFDFCEPKFYHGNGLCLAPLQTPYDRVYVGAGCPEEYQNYFQQLIKVGGIMVMPLNDNLLQVRRLSATEWSSRSLLNVSFATLRVPAKDEARELVRLDEQAPCRLQHLARGVIRGCMRACMRRRHPQLREPPPRAPPAKKACPRRICIPVDNDSDAEGLNALHDLDRASGANEMNALLSLVLSMGRNRGGALRVGSVRTHDPLDPLDPRRDPRHPDFRESSTEEEEEDEEDDYDLHRWRIYGARRHRPAENQNADANGDDRETPERPDAGDSSGSTDDDVRGRSRRLGSDRDTPRGDRTDSAGRTDDDQERGNSRKLSSERGNNKRGKRTDSAGDTDEDEDMGDSSKLASERGSNSRGKRSSTQRAEENEEIDNSRKLASNRRNKSGGKRTDSAERSDEDEETGNSRKLRSERGNNSRWKRINIGGKSGEDEVGNSSKSASELGNSPRGEGSDSAVRSDEDRRNSRKLGSDRGNSRSDRDSAGRTDEDERKRNSSKFGSERGNNSKSDRDSAGGTDEDEDRRNSRKLGSDLNNSRSERDSASRTDDERERNGDTAPRRPLVRSVIMFEFRDNGPARRRGGERAGPSRDAGGGSDRPAHSPRRRRPHRPRARRRDDARHRDGDTDTREGDEEQPNPEVPAEVEIYLGKSGEGTSAMEWEPADPPLAHTPPPPATTQPDLSSEEETDPSGAQTKTEKRQKLDSGIGEERSATPSSASPSASPASPSAPSDAADADPHPPRRGGRRRQKRGHRSTRSPSSSSGEFDISYPEGSDVPVRRPRRRGHSADNRRRVALSLHMKRAVKELPLPHALRKYVNLGRCFEF